MPGFEILSLLLISPVTLGKLFNLLSPQFPTCETGMIIIILIFLITKLLH